MSRTNIRSIENLKPSNAFEHEVSARVQQAAGQVVARFEPRRNSTPTRIALPRQVVAVTRTVLTQYGLTGRNDLVSAWALRPHRLPGAKETIWGRPTQDTHAGLAGAYGVLRKQINTARTSPAEAAQSFIRDIDNFTPDAVDSERRNLVVRGLKSVGLTAEILEPKARGQQPNLAVEGEKLALSLTPDDSQYLLATDDWITPYVGADWVDLGTA